MMSNRIKLAIEAGAVFGLIAGAIGLVGQLASAVPALGALVLPAWLASAVGIILGLGAGALAMLWGKGYVRTLVNSVVQGGVAGLANALVTLALTAIGVAAAASISGKADAVSAVAAWASAGLAGIETAALFAVILGMVGAIACAPFIVRIR